jgi:hypothetical protein
MKLKHSTLWSITSVLVLISLACSSLAAPTQTSSPLASPTANPNAPTPPANVYPPAFAAFKPVAVNLPAKFNGGDYALPVDLANVQHADEVELSGTQRQLLSQNGFVVLPPTPGQYREFYQIYESGRYDMHPVFITTDSIYHVYHLIFDKMLRDLERDSFIAILNSLTSTMLDASYQQYQSLKSNLYRYVP